MPIKSHLPLEVIADEIDASVNHDSNALFFMIKDGNLSKNVFPPHLSLSVIKFSRMQFQTANFWFNADR